jgi:hypothetical protein
MTEIVCSVVWNQIFIVDPVILRCVLVYFWLLLFLCSLPFRHGLSEKKTIVLSPFAYLYSKCHVISNKAPQSSSNPAHSLWWEEFLNTRSSSFNWPPFTCHTLKPSPLSEILLLRIQGYSWPCSKLRDTCYNTFKRHECNHRLYGQYKC